MTAIEKKNVADIAAEPKINDSGTADQKIKVAELSINNVVSNAKNMFFNRTRARAKTKTTDVAAKKAITSFMANKKFGPSCNPRSLVGGKIRSPNIG